MKLIRFVVGMLLLMGSTNISAEEEGFWSWLTDVTSSAWESTKRTVNSLFGGNSEEKVYKKEEIREIDANDPTKAKEEVIKKEETVVK